jgi:hypothetical protein
MLSNALDSTVVVPFLCLFIKYIFPLPSTHLPSHSQLSLSLSLSLSLMLSLLPKFSPHRLAGLGTMELTVPELLPCPPKP